jgi:chromosome segregation ATPase
VAEELEEERFARSEEKREAQREVGRLQQEVRDMSAELEGLWEEWHRPSKNSKSLWGSLFGAKSR